MHIEGTGKKVWKTQNHDLMRYFKVIAACNQFYQSFFIWASLGGKKYFFPNLLFLFSHIVKKKQTCSDYAIPLSSQT